MILPDRQLIGLLNTTYMDSPPEREMPRGKREKKVSSGGRLREKISHVEVLFLIGTGIVLSGCGLNSYPGVEEVRKGVVPTVPSGAPDRASSSESGSDPIVTSNNGFSADSDTCRDADGKSYEDTTPTGWSLEACVKDPSTQEEASLWRKNSIYAGVFFDRKDKRKIIPSDFSTMKEETKRVLLGTGVYMTCSRSQKTCDLEYADGSSTRRDVSVSESTDPVLPTVTSLLPTDEIVLPTETLPPSPTDTVIPQVAPPLPTSIPTDAFPTQTVYVPKTTSAKEINIEGGTFYSEDQESPERIALLELCGIVFIIGGAGLYMVIHILNMSSNKGNIYRSSSPHSDMPDSDVPPFSHPSEPISTTHLPSVTMPDKSPQTLKEILEASKTKRG